MRKITLFFLLTVLNTIWGFSQDFLTNSRSAEFFNDVAKMKFRESNANYQNIEGSPYFTSDFVKNELYFTTGDSLEISLRYDIYKDEVEFKNKDQILWLEKDNVKKIRMQNNILEIFNYKVGNKLLKGYFFCIKPGKNALYKKLSVTFLPAEQPKGYQDARSAKFEKNDDEYYLKTTDSLFFKVTKKNDLEGNLLKNKQVEAYIKSSKLKVGKERDLIKLVDYINTLQ
ncbi:MAG: hypothetical protein Q8928_08475 [Bacteroidota bacterium]|nr:hypothetical protein [Bacteroidota bacterium]